MSLAPSPARRDTLALSVNALFALAAREARAPAVSGGSSASIAGYRFEDDAAKAAYEALRRVGVTPYPPRLLLQLPTMSELKQQFDVVIADGSRFFIVELKNRSYTEIEQLYAFVAKLLDYALAAKLHGTGQRFTGIFVSTAPKLNKNFRQFALTYGVWPIAPDLPPCQVLLQSASDPVFRQDATDLIQALDVPLPTVALTLTQRAPARGLLQEWQALVQRQR